jgi:hypothetical protein
MSLIEPKTGLQTLEFSSGFAHVIHLRNNTHVAHDAAATLINATAAARTQCYQRAPSAAALHCKRLQKTFFFDPIIDPSAASAIEHQAAVFTTGALYVTFDEWSSQSLVLTAL